MIAITRWKKFCTLCSIWVMGAVICHAQTLVTLVNFDGTNGYEPNSALIQGIDGNFYGSTASGGIGDKGTLFKVSPSGGLTTLYEFCKGGNCSDGSEPLGGLLLFTDGSLFGVTINGGDPTCNCGTVFKLDNKGKFTTLHVFTGEDGSFPESPMVEGVDGNLYGTTEGGGTGNYGTVFTLNHVGVFRVLYSFCSQQYCADGSFPTGNMIQATDGDFYGTTVEGGLYNWGGIPGGTAFKVSQDGKFTSLYSFDGSAGAFPRGGLIQGSDGRFYGTAENGGDIHCAAPTGCGTVFSLTRKGEVRTLHRFNGRDGGLPYAGLIQATDGNLYGVTFEGGSKQECRWGCGVIFGIGPLGFRTLYMFGINGDDDNFLLEPLLQATNGTIYGVTGFGGTGGDGTVFSLDIGLGPFVALVRPAAKVGRSNGILGQGLTSTTGVNFNGVPASFKVISDTYLIATIPPHATTGYVTVTTPTGTLTSNKKFVVLP